MSLASVRELQPVDGVSWDVMLLILSQESRFLHPLACLCKDLPQTVKHYLWIQRLRSPLRPMEIRSNCGLVRRATGSVGCDSRVFKNGVSTAYSAYLPHDHEEYHVRICYLHNLRHSGGDLGVWMVDIASLLNIILGRMQATGMINIQMLKNIVTATLAGLANGTNKLFFKAFCEMNNMAFDPTAPQTAPQSIDETMERMTRTIQNYLPVSVSDTITYIPCAFVLQSQTPTKRE